MMSTTQHFRTAPPIRTVSYGITPREAECLGLAHLRNADIALALSISVVTVKKHLKSARQKLGAETRVAAVLLYKPVQSEHSEALAARRMGA